MKFTYSCIGDNTPENIKHLEKLGYRLLVNNELDDYLLTVTDSIEVYGGNYVPEYKNMVNCIGNPALFQSVTAMRDDSDYLQWFVTEADQAWVNQGIYAPKGSFEVCLIKDRYMGQDSRFCSRIVPAHKATLAELQEHFK